MRLPLACAGVVTLAVIGFGAGVAGAAPALVDSPMPIPSPVGAPALPGMPGMPGSAAGGSAAGVNAANSFLQALNGMLNRVVPGVGSIMPTDVSSLTPPGAPALETPPVPGAPAGTAPAPVPVPQTLAGSRTFSLR
ncbi:MAG: hypothetical protein ABI253_06155 [Mycobacterium sp.]